MAPTVAGRICAFRISTPWLMRSGCPLESWFGVTTRPSLGTLRRIIDERNREIAEIMKTADGWRDERAVRADGPIAAMGGHRVRHVARSVS